MAEEKVEIMQNNLISIRKPEGNYIKKFYKSNRISNNDSAVYIWPNEIKKFKNNIKPDYLIKYTPKTHIKISKNNIKISGVIRRLYIYSYMTEDNQRIMSVISKSGKHDIYKFDIIIPDTGVAYNKHLKDLIEEVKVNHIVAKFPKEKLSKICSNITDLEEYEQDMIISAYIMTTLKHLNKKITIELSSNLLYV